MNKLSNLMLNGALFALFILGLAGSTRAQSVLGASHRPQEGIQESADRQKRPHGDDATQRLLFWNEVVLKANARDHARSAPLKPEQGGPLRTARAFAIVQIAVFDAYNAIVGGYESYTDLDLISGDEDCDSDRGHDSDRGRGSDRRRASVDAAIAQAAGDTLKVLYPSQAADIAAVQETDLDTIPDGRAKDAGIRIGRRAAEVILAIRSNDGSQHQEPNYHVDYFPPSGPGKWTPDPSSGSTLAMGAHWASLVRPFVIRSADQFRAAPTPALDSAAYARAVDELKRVGGANSQERTEDQTIAGIYWAYDGTPFLGTPPRLYNQIVVHIADQMGTRGIELARLLALVNVAMADAGLASWDTKYHEVFWRPVTAIPNFVPLGAPASNTIGRNFTPPFPAYTSGHATFGGALFQTLRRFYRTDRIPFSFVSDEYNGVTRDNQGNVRPLVLRRFQSLSQAEEENGQSRIYLGIHWSFDKTEGIKQGRQVADHVFKNSFRRQAH
jgi:PAP2 superfamily